MTRTVKVNVTARDIREGVRGSVLACPHARAIGRALGEKVRVIPFYGVWVAETGEFVDYLPAKARAHLDHFDAGEPVEPIRYALTVDA